MEQPNGEARVSLRDLLNYDPDKYITDEEVAWIKTTFKDNPWAINVLRKMFLPTTYDLPLERLGEDVWFKGGADYAQIPEQEAKSIIVARQDAIKFVLGGLIALKNLAHSEDQETELERKHRLAKDSAK